MVQAGRRPARAGQGVPLLRARARCACVEVQLRDRGRLLHVPRQIPLRSRGQRSVQLGAPESAARRAQQGRVLRRDRDLSAAGRASAFRSQGDGTLRLQGGTRRAAPTSACATCRWNRRRHCSLVRHVGPRRQCRAALARFFASDMDIAAALPGQRRAGAGELLRLRPAARVHAVRAADDSDPVGASSSARARV